MFVYIFIVKIFLQLFNQSFADEKKILAVAAYMSKA